MVTTALNDPTLSFADEKVPQFETTSYYYPFQWGQVFSAQLKGGYWDQNIRNPGDFLPRNGGRPFNNAWNQAVQARATLKRVYLESWNEFDEGSGMFAANPGPPYILPGSGNTNTDVWSVTNDPYEYIKTTARGASLFNDWPNHDSAIVWHNIPTNMQPGETRLVGSFLAVFNRVAAITLTANTREAVDVGGTGRELLRIVSQATIAGTQPIESLAWCDEAGEVKSLGQGELQVTPLQNARWTAGVSTGTLVTPRLGLAIAAQRGSYTALPAPAPAPLPYAAQLGPVREGMRAAVTGGTATRLVDLPMPAGAKTGTAQNGGLPDGEYDNWISATAPMDAPEIVITAWVQGPGRGGNSATGVGGDGLRYYMAHRADILATGAVQAP